MSDTEHFGPAFKEDASSKLAYSTIASNLSSPYLSFGLPYPEACAKHVHQTLKRSRVFIICSGTLSRTTDGLERLIDALGENNVVGVRKGMIPHTLWSEIISITNEARAAKADCLVTLGAGTLTDGGKIVALALANDISTVAGLSEYHVNAPARKTGVKPPVVPLICIPTSLSGGEYFSLAGGTDDATYKKRAFLQAGMGAKLVILDAQLCASTPSIYWLSTGVRSIDHCVEAICSRDATITSDTDAEKGLRQLVPSLLLSKAEPGNLLAIHQAQQGVISAMKTIRSGIPMGGSHAIGHQLGPLGVGHGITSCVLCPAVMKYNARHGLSDSAIKKKQLKILNILWSEKSVASILATAGCKQEISDLGDVLDTIIRALGMPRTLKAVGVERGQIQSLAERTLEDAWAISNPIPLIEVSQVVDILDAVAE